MNRLLLLSLSLAGIVAVLSPSTASAQRHADTILVGGKVWTGNPDQPEAQALAIADGKVAAVGSDAEVRRWAGPSTTVIALQGRRVVPGFNDAHVHFFDGGQGLASVQLRDASSPEIFRDRIGAYADTLEKGRWVLNGNWDHERWTPAELPTRQLIDAVTPDNPVFINRLDGHMALANTLALKLAGITRDTPDPPGGSIVRDASGEPTGVLKDAAMNAVYAVIPEADATEISDALHAAMRYANENGVTSVQDMSASPAILRAYQQLLADGELTVRVYGAQPLSRWERLADAGIAADFGGDMLRIGVLKGFADGSLGSTTALFFEPYLDEPGTSGLPSDEMVDAEAMLADMLGADAAGLQLAVHAIGDKANAAILDMFAEVARRNGPRDRRLRIEHAQHFRMSDIPRMHAQGVIASMQPYHAIDDGRWAEKRIGAERAKGTYAFRSLLDAGAVLAFGSDWYVAPMEPLLGIYGAVTRRTLDGAHPDGWVPEQKSGVADAVRAYPAGSAYAEGQEAVKGTLEPGKLADLMVLSQDIFAIDPATIDKVRVDTTILGGRVVYQRAAE
ncbi:amidohydrolase [Luteimonas sp. 8-5]|uniref:amidohydrolase n=1 Tax=Luteimonas sp. 8-5 TaxID=3039387 RepID=UPI0024369A55|nr:amidohydrolase [Luteimonas sp. 8-5]MDG6347309.1 amidohydrolase [Luteimonas sp. 8-5]